MSTGPQEQRNRYKGSTDRPWIRVRLVAPDGTAEEIELIADTGNPYAVIIGTDRMARFSHLGLPSTESNFGPLEVGWLRVTIPDVALDSLVEGCGSDQILTHVRADSPDFEGLAGLPLLRLLEYGGDVDWFWIRPQVGVP
jgi:hypothetical protein